MQRADGVTDLFEMKHSSTVFTIDGEYARELQDKVEIYRQESKDRRMLHLVMVTTDGITRNNYINIIQNDITLDNLFVPAE